jgi:hypothetical protein
MSLNRRVLSRLYLDAVLPCLSDLSKQDPAVGDIIGALRASIVFQILGGPAATIRLSGREIAWESGCGRAPSVILLFFGDRHLNAFFAGRKWAVPLPVWGGWRVALLARFSQVAKLLEAVLNGDAAVLATAAGRGRHARLSLIAAVLALRPLAEGDAVARHTLRSLPMGLAAFNIEGEHGASLWFDHRADGCAAGWGEPPRRPEVCVTFANMQVAYGAMRDEIDTMAAVGCGEIKVEGLIPLADGLNVVMERLRVYLQPITR